MAEVVSTGVSHMCDKKFGLFGFYHGGCKLI